MYISVKIGGVCVGWRFQVGAIRACKIENGKLIIDSHPNPLTFDTQVPFNVDWQRNLFYGEDICFVLVAEDIERVIVGHTSGSVIILTYDGILAGISNWSVPLLGMDMTQIGYYNSTTGMYLTYASPFDPYWVHAGRRSMLLDEPVPKNIFCDEFDEAESAAWSLAGVIRNDSIMVAESEEDKIDAGSGEWYADTVSEKDNWLSMGEGG